MNLEWAQIKNFRSIKDSGRIYFNPNLTILAGKNESGKSNILKALDCFTKKSFDKDSDYPIDHLEEYPEVVVHYELEEDVLLHIINNYTISKKVSPKLNGVTITRSAESSELIEIEAFQDTLNHAVGIVSSAVAIINSELRATFKINGDMINSPKLPKTIEDIKAILLTIKGSINNEQFVKMESTFQEIDSVLLRLVEFQIYIQSDEFVNKIPNFVYFSSFEDILPNSISSSEEVTPIVYRFFKVVNLEISALFSEKSPQKRRRLTDTISTIVSGDFMEYYSQDSVSLKINLDGNEINFFVYGKDNQKPFQPRQRSQGLQWFLSFYLTLQAEMRTGSILLIDEPGLYLHASAQEDLLGMLNNLSIDSPIVISTHSHWLMDPNRLERIRLVLKEDDHTFVENKIHKGADKYTMKPILSAIGLGLNHNISTFGKKVILVEGYSDYYYLVAMRYYFSEKLGIDYNDIKFYPCQGCSQIINVLTLIIDSDTEYYILLDNDKGGKQTERRLITECGVDNDRIVLIPLVSKSSSVIEDMFSETDLNEIVFKSLDKAKSNKILVSKKFNEFMHNNEITMLSNETVSNFKKIFDAIETSRTSHSEK